MFDVEQTGRLAGAMMALSSATAPQPLLPTTQQAPQRRRGVHDMTQTQAAPVQAAEPTNAEMLAMMQETQRQLAALMGENAQLRTQLATKPDTKAPLAYTLAAPVWREKGYTSREDGGFGLGYARLELEFAANNASKSAVVRLRPEVWEAMLASTDEIRAALDSRKA